MAPTGVSPHGLGQAPTSSTSSSKHQKMLPRGDTAQESDFMLSQVLAHQVTASVLNFAILDVQPKGPASGQGNNNKILSSKSE